MSLRILLADESPSIKKAFSLALKDYGVQIQTVHQGTDVAELYEKFQPDICFMDVMLPKLNGYDASKELKSNEVSKQTPVVLMWSGFMELDEEKFQQSLADSSIEKPFETETLRAIVKSLVPKTQQNAISEHIVFDDSPDAPDEDLSAAIDIDDIPDIEIPSLNNSQEGAELSELPSIDSLKFDHLKTNENSANDEGFPDLPDLDSILGENDDISDFSTPEGLSLDALSTNPVEETEINITDEWKSEELQEFEASEKDLAPEGLDDIEPFSMEQLDSEKLPFETDNAGEDKDLNTPEGLDLPPTPDKMAVLKEAAKEAAMETMRTESSAGAEMAKPQQATAPVVEALKEEGPSEAVEPLKEDSESELLNASKVPQMSKEELKRLVLAQSKDIIESVVWDVVPELAKEMIQKEIQRLTGEIKHEGELR